MKTSFLLLVAFTWAGSAFAAGPQHGPRQANRAAIQAEKAKVQALKAKRAADR